MMIHKSRPLKGSRVMFVGLIPIILVLAGFLEDITKKWSGMEHEKNYGSKFMLFMIFSQIIATRGWLILARLSDAIYSKIKGHAEPRIHPEYYRSYGSLFVVAIFMSWMFSYLLQYFTSFFNKNFTFVVVLFYYFLCYIIGMMFAEPKKQA